MPTFLAVAKTFHPLPNRTKANAAPREVGSEQPVISATFCTILRSIINLVKEVQYEHSVEKAVCMHSLQLKSLVPGELRGLCRCHQ